MYVVSVECVKNFVRQHAETNGLRLFHCELKKKWNRQIKQNERRKKIMWISCGHILISLHYIKTGEAVEAPPWAAHYIFIISRKSSLMSLNLMIRVNWEKQ